MTTTVAPFQGFKRAVRESVGLLIGIAGPSGGGKTLSAMRLAKGIAGKKPFAVIDTEAGRAKHYADHFTFDHADLRAPFRPEAYARAIAAADAAGYPVIVVDSMSHEHAGDGGLLDWHEEEFQRLGSRDTVKMTAWIAPKRDHKRMVSRLLQIRAHLILCFRAEQKTDMVKNPETKKLEVVAKRTLSGFYDWIPVCEKNLPYELTASFLVLPDRPGVPVPIKLQKQHRELFPEDQPINEQAGARIAEWARGGKARVGREVESGDGEGPAPVAETSAAAAAPEPSPDSSVPEPSAGSGSAGGSAPAEGSPIEISKALRTAMNKRIVQLGLVPTAAKAAMEKLESIVVDYIGENTREIDIAQKIRDWRP